jgi:putative membrane-bound dehydrogenase-like protein
MQRPLITCLALVLCLPLTGWSAEGLKFPTMPPVEARNAAQTFHVLDGFEMQLIAAEPLVTDPVAITYDEDGRAFVCEMNDYPYTDKEHHKHAQENPTDQSIGKVRLLTDTDGDGVLDKATVFAEGLSWPTGAACWKGGIFVTATPDVWYLKDTNGDGVADVRQRVFTGFKKLNVQAVMNNPIWGLDHRIYIAGGSNGGEIQRVPGSEAVMPLPDGFKPLPIKRNDFSFDPSTGDVRLESGGARFGNTFDDWGNRFLCNIRNPCQHVVLPYRYLARNPYLVVPSALNDCAEAGDQLPVYRTSPAEPWREFRAKRWVQEGSTLPKSELVGAGVVTSSAGITVYRGDAYPPEYRDFVFVADVAGNLFYRMKLVPDGVTFKAVQVDGNKNFCTSDDLWFRPVNFVNAPDGCLHVCDMYREVIEHPWSIPDDIHAAVDLLRGRDKGRLFRLAPKSYQWRATPKLSAASTLELVALLDHPNAWHRETAQRLLFEQQDKATVGALRAMVKKGKTVQGKVDALWSLLGLGFGESQLWKIAPPSVGAVPEGIDPTKSQLGELHESWLDEVLNSDASPPMLVSCAWRLKAMFVAATPPAYQRFNDNTLVMRTSIIKPGTQALMWAAFALGEAGYASDYYPERLAYLIRNGVGDPWFGTAAELAAASMDPRHIVFLFACGGVSHAPAAFANILRSGAERLADTESKAAELISFLGKACEQREHVQGHNFIEDESIETILIGLSKGLQAKKIGWQDLKPSEQLSTWVSKRCAAALTTLGDRRLLATERERSMKVLALVPAADAMKSLSVLLKPDEPQELQLAALEALGSYHETAVADILIDSWPKLTPTLREKAISLMLSRTDRIAKLLDAIEAKQILPAQLSAAAKATLGRQKTPALAERIAKLIGDGISSNRKAVIDRYAAEMSGDSSGAGDAARGAKVYETLCMVCHRHLDRGNDVGPNLGTIKAWTAEQILTNILDPNREVSPNFALYIVETNDGRTLSGLITSETAGNLTLKRADGGTDTVLRSEIKSLTSPGISLMPEGLEAAITPQQMADLIAYLKAP